MHLVDIQQTLDTLLEPGPHTVLVDMAGLERLSSSTVAALLWIKRSCSARRVDVKLRRPSRAVVDHLIGAGLLETVSAVGRGVADGHPVLARGSALRR